MGLKHLELLTVFKKNNILTVQNTVILTTEMIIIHSHALKFSQTLTGDTWHSRKGTSLAGRLPVWSTASLLFSPPLIFLKTTKGCQRQYINTVTISEVSNQF